MVRVADEGPEYVPNLGVGLIFTFIGRLLWRKTCHFFGRRGKYVAVYSAPDFKVMDAFTDMYSKGELKPPRVKQVYDIDQVDEMFRACDQGGHHCQGAFVLKIP